MIYNPSITQYERTEAFELQVARGMVAGHSLINIQGYNAAQPNGFRAVWEQSNTAAYVYPAMAVAMAFTSSLTENLTMLVNGLDENYAIKTAIVTFTGSTTGTVTTGTNLFFRINSMQIISGNAADTIVATNGGTIYAEIAPGLGRSQASIYTVPANHTFYLIRAQAFTTNNGQQYCSYRVYSQTINGGIITPNIVLTAPFTQNYSSTRIVPRPYSEKTDIQWQLSQSNPAPGSIQVEGILIKNV